MALFAWPFVCMALFVRFRVETAAIASMLGGYLLLPSHLQVDVPLLPPIDKMFVAAVSTFLLCWMKGTQAPRPRPSPFIYLFSAGCILSPILTSFTNSYELQTAAGSIPGYYPLDGIKTAGRQAIALLPLFVGIRFLSSDEARGLLLKSLPTAITIYSLPMLFEIRMSPQLHRWVYGYHPSEFQQQMRAGGFRPVVFTEHGLMLALLTALAFLAAVIIARRRGRILGAPASAVAAYLGGLLVLCKSLGPVIYAAVFAPLVLLTRPRLWVKIACALSLVVLAYPALRSSGVIPVHHVASAAAGVSIDRSKSFETRVYNEDLLLAKAEQKPWLGWGTWGRNRVYDRDTGKDISITDGQWIIQFGMYGWFGYLSLFGLLAATIFGALRGVGQEATPQALTLGGLTLLLAIHVVDLIPNANSMSLTFLLAGSIAASARARAAAPIRQRRGGSTSAASAAAAG